MFDEKLLIKLDTAPELIKGRQKVMKIKSAALESCKILSGQQSGNQCPFYFFIFHPTSLCMQTQPLFLSLLR